MGGEEDMQPQTKHSQVGPGADPGRTGDGRGTDVGRRLATLLGQMINM